MTKRLERNGQTIITGLIAILATLITFVLAGTPAALLVSIVGVMLTSIVGITVTEREDAAHIRERRAHEARLAPARSGALRQVAAAAFDLVAHAMVYRDVAGADPRQRWIRISDLARGDGPEAGWSMNEADRLYDQLTLRAKEFSAQSGPAVAELDLPLRQHVHDINDLLRQAVDDMSAVSHAASQMFNGRLVGLDDEVVRGHALLDEATRALRTRLEQVVTRAQTLMEAARDTDSATVAR